MFSGKRPNNLGVRDGKLALCPNTPNCVSSQSSDTEHNIEPLTFNSTPREAMADLKTVLQNLKKPKSLQKTRITSMWNLLAQLWGFVDDVEFSLDETAKVIHVRSASRLGQSDLGVNRKRIETIRTNLKELKIKS